MKIYSFWSGDTTYFTKSKSLKKAQSIGRENYEDYLEACKYLEEQPEVEAIGDFVPQEVERETIEWFNHLAKFDSDVVILDDELYSFLK